MACRLGLAAIKLWTREEVQGAHQRPRQGPNPRRQRQASVNDHTHPIEKESINWPAGERPASHRDLSDPSRGIVHIGDRESDIYSVAASANRSSHTSSCLHLRGSPLRSGAMRPSSRLMEEVPITGRASRGSHGRQRASPRRQCWRSSITNWWSAHRWARKSVTATSRTDGDPRHRTRHAPGP